MLRTGYSVFLFVPEMNAGLVTDLHWSGQVTEDLVPGLYNHIFCLPGQVGAVEVNQIVIGYASFWKLASDYIPNSLEEASG